METGKKQTQKETKELYSGLFEKHNGDLDKIKKEVAKKAETYNIAAQYDSTDLANGLDFGTTKQSLKDNLEEMYKYEYLVRMLDADKKGLNMQSEYVTSEHLLSKINNGELKAFTVHGRDEYIESDAFFVPAYLLTENKRSSFLFDTGYGNEKLNAKPTDFIAVTQAVKISGEPKEGQYIFNVIDGEKIHTKNVVFTEDELMSSDRDKLYVLSENPLLYYLKENNTPLTNIKLFDILSKKENGVPSIVHASQNVRDFTSLFPTVEDAINIISDYFAESENRESMKEIYNAKDEHLNALDYLREEIRENNKLSEHMASSIFYDYAPDVKSILLPQNKSSRAKDIEKNIFDYISSELGKRSFHVTEKEFEREGLSHNEYEKLKPSFVPVQRALEENGFKEFGVGKNKEYEKANKTLKELAQTDTVFISKNLVMMLEFGTPKTVLSQALDTYTKGDKDEKKACLSDFLGAEKITITSLSELMKKDLKNKPVFSFESIVKTKDRKEIQKNLESVVYELSKEVISSTLPDTKAIHENNKERSLQKKKIAPIRS